MDGPDTFMQAAAAFLDFDNESDVEATGREITVVSNQMKSSKKSTKSISRPKPTWRSKVTREKKRICSKQAIEEMESFIKKHALSNVMQPFLTNPKQAIESLKFKSNQKKKKLTQSDYEQWIAAKKDTACKAETKRKGKKGKKRGKGDWSSSEEPEDVSSDIDIYSCTDSDHGDCKNVDVLYGCTQCQYRWSGCQKCRKEDPMVQRPRIEWDPSDLHEQENIPSGPVYYPTEAEFADPFRYIAQIRAEAEQYGICRIVPPPSWSSPIDPLHKSNEEYEFYPKRQLVSSLCIRDCTPSRKKNEEKTSDYSDEDEFGFGTSEMPFTFQSFKAFADWAHQRHFIQKDNISLPSTKQMEGEFWRLVENGHDEEFETFYGSDLDASLFPKAFAQPPVSSTPYKADWNVCTWPRSVDSVLRFIPGEELINGVMVPWVYFGSSLSAFCWHIEDHALYSINYLHKGAHKIWYGIPCSRATDFESAMMDAFPQLFESDPRLLHRLVTHLSPTELKKRGVPVYRIVHEPGSFVITFPNGYHGGFNCGWNCAEAVNFAPPDWLPHGSDVVRKYRELKRQTTFSHDALLLQIVVSFHNKSSKLSPLALKYAIAELHLRTEEEARRRAVAHKIGISRETRMYGDKDARDYDGVWTDGEEKDCAVCKCDLFLSAVVSSSNPGKAVCPEHADYFPTDRSLIYRLTITELWDLIAKGKRPFPAEVDAFVERARARVQMPCVSSIKKRGPFCCRCHQRAYN